MVPCKPLQETYHICSIIKYHELISYMSNYKNLSASRLIYLDLIFLDAVHEQPIWRLKISLPAILLKWSSYILCICQQTLSLGYLGFECGLEQNAHCFQQSPCNWLAPLWDYSSGFYWNIYKVAQQKWNAVYTFLELQRFYFCLVIIINS